MSTRRAAFALFVSAALIIGAVSVHGQEKQPIKAIYIPLADHYSGVVAYEKYAAEMKKADYTIERMKSWPLLRAYFMSGEVDLAYIICPMAMDMFLEKPNFRWVSLLHRDGNALAINDLLNKHVRLPRERLRRKPDAKVAAAFSKAKAQLGRPSECGVPHLLATHTVVLYKYLKDHRRTQESQTCSALEQLPSVLRILFSWLPPLKMLCLLPLHINRHATRASRVIHYTLNTISEGLKSIIP